MRSTHSFPFVRDIGPRERVRSALGSFREVLAGKSAKLRKGSALNTTSMASSAPADDPGGPMRVRLKIPGKTLTFVPDLKQARMVTFNNGTSFFGEVRRDLEKDGNLKAVFAQNPGAIGTVRDMAQDYPTARAMIFRQIEKYIGIQQQCLILQPLPERKLMLRNQSGSAVLELDVQLAPDDLSVIVFDLNNKPAETTNQ